MIIDTGEAHWVLEGWAWHIRQCNTVDAIDAAEQRLHKTMQRNRDKERPSEWIRDALALCAERRNEIAAAAAMRPGASGQQPNKGTSQHAF